MLFFFAYYAIVHFLKGCILYARNYAHNFTENLVYYVVNKAQVRFSPNNNSQYGDL